jgi:hypothetical protein
LVFSLYNFIWNQNQLLLCLLYLMFNILRITSVNSFVAIFLVCSFWSIVMYYILKTMFLFVIQFEFV